MNYPDVSTVINDGLYISSIRVYKTSWIRDNDISYVIDLSGVDNLSTVVSQNKEAKYMRIMIDDLPSSRISAHFYICINFIEEARRNKKKVLVNCYAGISRSASIVIVYLMYLMGFSVDEALKFLRFKRGIVNPNVGFLEQLRMFERRTR